MSTAVQVPSKKAANRAEMLYLYSLITLLSFCLRDGFTGSMRYYLKLAHLSFLWFIPDLLAFGSVAIFIYLQCFKERNPIGIFFVCAFAWSMAVSVLFMNDNLLSLFSSAKMFIPMFVGFCLYGRDITERRWARMIFVSVFLISAIGVIINPHITFPWVGQTIESFGMEREATKVWWSGGVQRYGGFAGDSTMAGFMTLFTYVLISPYYSVLLNAISWPMTMTALYYTNSKTAMGIFAVYILIYCYVHMINRAQGMRVLRLCAKLSFLSLLLPPILMITLGGVDLGAISQNLASLGDRINNTWTGPFLYVAQLFPVGLFTGCGIGCYSYPMMYTSMAQYSLPLDNFYLATFLMMGYPFVYFVITQLRGLNRIDDPIKLTLIMLWNVYTITVQCYGPSYATLLYGYAFSEVFAKVRKKQKQQTATVAPPREGPPIPAAAARMA